jgi:transposase
MKFHDPSIEYIDYGYFDAKAKERDANDRLKQLVKELKSL